MTEEQDSADRLRVASDPNTSGATLADLAYDHADVRAAIAGNPATYEGLLGWLGELNDPDVNAALGARSRGVTEVNEPSVLRLDTAPTEALPSSNQPVVLSPTEPERLAPAVEPPMESSSRWPAFLTRRFVLVIGAIVVLAVVAIVIGVSSHNAALAAQASATEKAQRAAADKANATNAAQGTKPSHTAAPSPTPTASPTPLPPPSIVPAGFSQTWTQGFVGSGGYTETVTISVGTPEPLGSNYPRQVPVANCSSASIANPCAMTTFKSGQTCTANKATDAVVPMSVDTTSTTSAFTQVVGSRLLFQSNTRLQYEASYNNGLICNDGTNGALIETGSSTKPLKNGAATTLPMFLIIQNYYTPDHPQGDASLLAGISIYVSGSSSSVAWQGDGKPVIHQVDGSASGTLPAGSALQLG